jgi:hypothetical protein
MESIEAYVYVAAAAEFVLVWFLIKEMFFDKELDKNKRWKEIILLRYILEIIFFGLVIISGLQGN